MRDLGLKDFIVVYPGARSYEVGENIRAMPLSGAISELAETLKSGSRKV
jgi:hypothetical protein